MKLKVSLFVLTVLLFLFKTSIQAEENSKNWQDKVDGFFGEYAVKPLVSFLFWEIP